MFKDRDLKIDLRSTFLSMGLISVANKIFENEKKYDKKVIV